jgi:hypothetical protein
MGLLAFLSLKLDATKAHALIAEHRAEVVAERDAETVAWLTKKAREFRANGETTQADTAALLASKVDRGAVRANNLRMLPADFFEPGRTYTEDAPFRAPEDRPNFQCIAVAIHPTTGGRRALGFEQPGAGSPWRSSSMRDEEWADGWTDITEGGAP